MSVACFRHLQQDEMNFTLEMVSINGTNHLFICMKNAFLLCDKEDDKYLKLQYFQLSFLYIAHLYLHR